MADWIIWPILVIAGLLAYALRRFLAMPSYICVFAAAALVGLIFAVLIVLNGGTLTGKWTLFTVGMAFAFWGVTAGLVGLGTAVWRE